MLTRGCDSGNVVRVVDLGPQPGADYFPPTGKRGRRIPDCGVPIHPVDDLRVARPDVVLVLTWDIADEVFSQLEADGGWGAEYLIPMPEPHVVARRVRTVRLP